MMDCREAIELIGARLAGRLEPPQDAALDAHLAACAACRRSASGQALFDGALRRAFTDRRRRAADVAERVAARVTDASSETPRMRSGGASHADFASIAPRTADFRGASSRWRMIPAAAGLAAGFLLAVILFPPWKKTNLTDVDNGGSQSWAIRSPNGGPGAIARLTLATGPIEVRLAAEAPWQPLPTGAVLPIGGRVRTGPEACCEFTTPDGSEVRLNRGTEIVAAAARQFELAAGQVYCTVAPDPTPFEVRTVSAAVTALGTQFDVSCRPAPPEPPNTSSTAVEASAQTCVTVVEGAARLGTAGGAQTVSAGESVCVSAGGAPIKTRVDDLVEATRWVHDLLVLKGRADPELKWRVDDLLARIGRSKMEHLHERDIRALGDRCVTPLCSYVGSTGAREDPHRVARAARMACDLAQPWNIPDLIGLLDHADGEIRSLAAAGLLRLTGETLGRPPDAWRAGDGVSCSAGSANWRNWWEENKDRYPASR